jgi:peptide/nickel transport system permease protein
MWTTTSVISEISAAWPVTLELGILAIIISQLIALPIGIFSALRQDTWGDYLARSFAILFIAIPGFWIATLVMVFPSIWWGWTPSIVYIPFVKDPIGSLGMFILPAVVLGLNGSGSTMRMTRTMMLEVMRQDYIRTAWAKGLRERVVVTRHTLKNALIPVVTIIGMQLPSVIGGAVIIETIFGLPGMGRLIVTSTTQRDYTMVSGVMLFFAVGLVLINIIVDLTYGILDPRVHYK